MQDMRRLAAYPECAVILDENERQACCEDKCLSEACQEFCFNDITYPPDTFVDCDGLTGDALNDCCEEWSGGNQYKKFDC